MLQHRLGVGVGDKKRNVVALSIMILSALDKEWRGAGSHLDGFPPQHDEALRTLHQESGKLVA